MLIETLHMISRDLLNKKAVLSQGEPRDAAV